MLQLTLRAAQVAKKHPSRYRHSQKKTMIALAVIIILIGLIISLLLSQNKEKYQKVTQEIVDHYCGTLDEKDNKIFYRFISYSNNNSTKQKQRNQHNQDSTTKRLLSFKLNTYHRNLKKLLEQLPQQDNQLESIKTLKELINENQEVISNMNKNSDLFNQLEKNVKFFNLLVTKWKKKFAKTGFTIHLAQNSSNQLEE